MQKNLKITAFQLFTMLYISRMVINVTYNTYISPDGDMTDFILSALASIPLSFILSLPVAFLYIQDNKRDLTANCIDYMGTLGKITVVLYALYFLAVCIYNFAFYNNFVINVMAPKTPVVLIGICIMLCSVYGAFKGLRALAGVSGMILIIFVAGFLLLVCAMLPYNKDYNFTPFFYYGSDNFFTGLKVMLEHSSPIVVMAVILPYAKGKVKANYFVCLTGVYVTIAILLFAVIGVMGDCLKTQLFAVYSYSGLAQAGIIKRMDSLYIAVWTSGLFVKLSLYLFCFSVCIKKLFGEKSSRIALPIAGTVVLVVSLIIASNTNIYLLIKNEISLFVVSLIMSFLIPLGIFFVKKSKRKVVNSA